MGGLFLPFLGVFSVNGTAINTGSFNDIKTSGIYAVGASVTDGPATGFGVQVQMIVWGNNNNNIIQVITRTSQSKIAFRTCDSGTWKTWQLVTATAIT